MFHIFFFCFSWLLPLNFRVCIVSAGQLLFRGFQLKWDCFGFGVLVCSVCVIKMLIYELSFMTTNWTTYCLVQCRHISAIIIAMEIMIILLFELAQDSSKYSKQTFNWLCNEAIMLLLFFFLVILYKFVHINIGFYWTIQWNTSNHMLIT